MTSFYCYIFYVVLPLGNLLNVLMKLGFYTRSVYLSGHGLSYSIGQVWIALSPSRGKLNCFILLQFNYILVFLHYSWVYFNYFLLLLDILVLRGRTVKLRCLVTRVECVCFIVQWDITAWYTCFLPCSTVYLYYCRVVRYNLAIV